MKLAGTRVKVPPVELGCSRRNPISTEPPRAAGLEAEGDEPAGRNDSEPHRMSLEKLKTGEQPSRCFTGTGRREKTGQPPASWQRSGGVGVGGTSVSSARESWENSGDGCKTQPTAQAGPTSEAGGVTGAVGVPHINVDLLDHKRGRESRGDACSMRGGEGKDAVMAGATQIKTPDKVRTLQMTLDRKAKAEPKYRFWSLYGERLRLDVLERAIETQRQNGGGSGGGWPETGHHCRGPRRPTTMAGGLREELRRKTCRPSPVRRVRIPKHNGGTRPLGIPTVKDRVVQTALLANLYLNPLDHGVNDTTGGQARREPSIAGRAPPTRRSARFINPQLRDWSCHRPTIIQTGS